MARKSKSSGRKQSEREFAVVGLGRFGASLSRRLEAMGHIVLGVDQNIGTVQTISDDITSAVVLDPTNEDALQEVDIGSFGTVIVALEDDFEASALVASYLKSLGIAQVICLAETSRHRDILLRIGADQVIVSDEDSGIRLAEVLAMPDLQERVVLDTENGLFELRAPDKWTGKPLSSLALSDLGVVLIRRGGLLIPCPAMDTRVEEDDTLFVVGQRAKILALSSKV